MPMKQENNINTAIEKIEHSGRKIYDKAVTILASQGILVENEFWHERILSHTGSSSKGNRIFFTENLIKTIIPFGGETDFKLDVMEDSFQFTAAQVPFIDGIRYKVGGFAMSVYDAEQNVVRPSTMKDLEESLMLCDVLKIGGPYPCTATDVHPLMMNIASHKMCFTKSSINVTHVLCGLEQAKIIYDMHQVMGHKAQMPLTLTIVSPLRIEETNLKVIEYFIKKGVDCKSLRIVPVGYGLSGMTYPITLGGSWTMCLAEHMGLFLCAKMLESGFDIAPSVGPVGACPIDYQAMALAGGNPNQALYSLANTILAYAVLGKNYRNYPEIEAPLWTGSPVPDMQSAVEKFSVIAGACERGATMFGRLGALCVDDVFSPEQLLADVEMIDYGRKRATAFSNIDTFMDIEGLNEEVTDFINNDNSFMMADSTLKHLRTLYPAPGAFVHKKMASMLERGFSSFIKEMSARKQDALKKYDFNLDESKQHALNKIYSDAERLLTKT